MVNSRGSKVQSDRVDASCAVEVGEHLLERKVPGRRNRDPLTINWKELRHAPLRTNCLLEGSLARRFMPEPPRLRLLADFLENKRPAVF